MAEKYASNYFTKLNIKNPTHQQNVQIYGQFINMLVIIIQFTIIRRFLMLNCHLFFGLKFPKK